MYVASQQNAPLVDEVLAEEAMELLPDGVLQEGDAAHVAGRVPGVGGLIVVFDELAEVRRQKLLVIALDGCIEARGDEGRRVPE